MKKRHENKQITKLNKNKESDKKINLLMEIT